MLNSKKGSEWRKWDLHIHAPSKYTCAKKDDYIGVSLEDKQANFIDQLKLVEDISVLGITDYFSLDGYKKVIEYRDQLNNFDLILPNLELRITPETNDSKKINLHVIFNTEVLTIDKIERFLYKFELQQQGTNFNCSKDDLIGLGKTFESSLSDESAFKKGLNEFSISYEKFFEILRKQDELFLENIMVIVSNNSGDGASGIKDLSGIRNIIYQGVNCIFSAQPKDREYFLGNGADTAENIIKKYSGLKPCIHGSDYHGSSSGKKICIPDFNRFCWIKADPTFEGLKQIIYEPEERVYIGDNKPSDNLNKITEIKLDFNENVKIKANGSSNEYDFCFSNLKENLYLNDYFNCFIGGRGSGKSSLLNLIYGNITGKKETHFLENNYFLNLDIENNLIIDYKGEIEFLGQNQIEDFATDYVKFSKAIYKRLENQNELEQESKKLEEYIDSLDEYIYNIREIEKNKKELSNLEKRLISYENILNIVRSEEYNNLKKDFDNYKNEFYEIENSKEKYNKLKYDFIQFLNNFSNNQNENNDFDTKYNRILIKLKTIVKEIEEYDFSEIKLKQKKTLEKGKQEKGKLDKYLQEKGLSEEKLKNLTEAQEGLHKGKIKQENINNELQKFTVLQNKLSIKEGKLIFSSYEYLIKEGLKKAEEVLNGIKNDNIRNFEFNVNFNIEIAKKDLLNEFIDNTFKDYKKNGLRSDIINDSLFNEEINLIKILDGNINYIEFSNYIKSLNGINNDFLKNIFELESNFEIYKILIAKYLCNLNKYLKIEILYDKRPIEASSFGQKCTVVILIMLLFGNKPIIIDEPEAHLDSSLIANYLVDLIKQRKKERQIIFATHNANFVINGDAEQIYILENKDNKTIFTQTTIENLKEREKILNLEGGKEAFGLRGKKYYITK